EDVDGAVEPGGVAAGRADDGEAVGEVDGRPELIELVGVEAGEGAGVDPGAAGVRPLVVVDEGSPGVRAGDVGARVADDDPVAVRGYGPVQLPARWDEDGVGEPGGADAAEDVDGVGRGGARTPGHHDGHVAADVHVLDPVAVAAAGGDEGGVVLGRRGGGQREGEEREEGESDHDLGGQQIQGREVEGKI